MISDLKVLYPTDYVLVGGNWNMTPDEWVDRMPPRLGKPQCNDTVKSFMTDNNLIDVWKRLNPDVKSYSWFKPNGANKSRIDYWLVSDDILKYTSYTRISKAPLSDHCFKFNARLLQNEEYCNKIRDLINENKNNESIGNNMGRWEFTKFKIRQFTIKFCKELKKKKREYESNLLREISMCCSEPDLNPQEKNKLMELQAKLDDLYLERAQGAFIRSRAKWTEAGEKNSSYFSNLEKSRQQRNSITSLMINGIENKDFRSIEKEVYSFYSKLYSSSYSLVDTDIRFNKIEKSIPCIDNSFKGLCESDFKIDELDSVMFKMALNKSPGTDGLTTNFYQFFWKDVRDLLFDALKECIEKKELMSTMKQGLITLIPKPGKDKRILDNLRPITLLNTDYKIFSGAIAARLKEGISSLISETQSGFLKGRLIHNNIRLVLDLLDYSQIVQESGFILFLDFYKAFDSVEHPFILKTLYHFGFGNRFIDVIGMLYNGINSSVSLGNGTCSRFEIKRGIRQGCGSSPLLFIMVAEMLSILIKNGHIEGLNVMDKQIVISQLADDTTLFLKNEDQIPLALQSIHQFSKASGLQLNLNKCEILTLHDCHLQSLYNMKIKQEVKYLGIVISKDNTTTEKMNIWNNVDKCKSILNRWLQRDISIFGRVLLSKMDSLSRLIYPAFSLPISTRMIKTINTVNFKFIWRNRCQYIRKNDMVKNYDDGGLNVIDFDIMNGVLKLKWLKSFLTNRHSFWFIVPNMIFKKMGGIDFLLRFECSSLPLKLSTFHQQVLLYWKLIYSHNFTPHNTPVWNNRYILLSRKSVYIEDWKSKGVWAVAHFLDDTGNVLQFEDFCKKYQIQCNVKHYNRVIKAIPISLRAMVREDIRYYKVSPELRQLCINGLDFCDFKCTNKVIRNILLEEYYPNPIKRRYILKEFEVEKIRKIRKNYISLPLPPKIKELNFKILNEIYPTNEFLRLRFNFDLNNCIFCEKEIETLQHLFFHCNSVQYFWNEMQSWLQSKNIELPLTEKTVIFGVFVEDKNLDFVLNTLMLLGKFFIHKCRYFKLIPCMNHWRNELKLFSKSLKLVQEKKALKMFSLFEKYDLI